MGGGEKNYNKYICVNYNRQNGYSLIAFILIVSFYLLSLYMLVYKYCLKPVGASVQVLVFFPNFCFGSPGSSISSNIFSVHYYNSHSLLTAKLFFPITWLIKQFYLSCTWKQTKSKINIIVLRLIFLCMPVTITTESQ